MPGRPSPTGTCRTGLPPGAAASGKRQGEGDVAEHIENAGRTHLYPRDTANASMALCLPAAIATQRRSRVSTPRSPHDQRRANPSATCAAGEEGDRPAESDERDEAEHCDLGSEPDVRTGRAHSAGEYRANAGLDGADVMPDAGGHVRAGADRHRDHHALADRGAATPSSPIVRSTANGDGWSARSPRRWR